jgi:hypothetical protein
VKDPVLDARPIVYRHARSSEGQHRADHRDIVADALVGPANAPIMILTLAARRAE